MNSDSKYSGHPDHLDSHFPNSPTFDYELTSEDKFLDFTLRSKDQLNETGQSSTTYNSQPILSSSNRLHQSQKTSGPNESNVFRKEKPPKSKEDALYLPYSGSARRSDLATSQRSQKSSAGTVEKTVLKPPAKQSKGVERAKSSADAKKYIYEQDLGESYDEKGRSYSSNRSQRDLMGNVKEEIEELRRQLKNKEREMWDNMQLIENLQQMVNKGDKRVEVEMIQELQARKRKLEEENEELRQTLRNEIMVSERQRSQYEILQNSIDGKLETFGFMSPSVQSGLRGVDLLIEYQNLQVEMKHKEEEIKQLMEKIEILETKNEKINKALGEYEKEKEKMHEDIDNSLKALQSSRENQRKLEEEKAELIDYFNQQLDTQDQKIEGTKALEMKIEQLQQEVESWKEQAANADNQYKIVEAELEEKMEMLASLHDEKVELLESNNILKEEKEAVLDAMLKMEEDVEKLKDEINNLNKQREDDILEFERTRHEQSEIQRKLEEELEEARKEIQELGEGQVEREKRKEALDKKFVEERQGYEKRLKEQKEMFDNLVLTEKHLNEQKISEIEELYKNKMKEERESQQAQLEKIKKMYEEKLEESARNYEAKLYVLSETEGQLETQRISLNTQSEALSKLNTENQRLRGRVKDLEREHEDAHSMHSQEIRKYENLVETKNKEIQAIAMSNQCLKAELESLQSSMNATREDLVKANREIDARNQEQIHLKTLTGNLESQLADIKAANGFLNRYYNRQEQELEEYEGKVVNTLTSLRFAERNMYNMETENEILKTENDELKADINGIKQENMRLKLEAKELEDANRDYERKCGLLESDLETLRRDKSRITREQDTMREEIRGIKGEEGSVRDMVDDLMSILGTFVEDMNRSSMTAQNFLGNCTGQLRDMLKNSDRRDEGKDLRRDCEYLQSWFVMLLREIEKDVLNILKLKEEVGQLKKDNVRLMERANRVEDPDKYAVERAEDFKQQLKVIREEKMELQGRIYSLQEREEVSEKERARLKRENSDLNALVNELKESNTQLRASMEHLSKESMTSKSVLEEEVMAVRTVKGHCETLVREKKGLEDLFNVIIQSIPNEDQASLIKDMVDLQQETSRLEKESVTVENVLMENESDLKVSLKMGSKTPNDIIKKRREVERMRQELQNISTQLGIFAKRRMMLVEELKNFERIEKRRFNQALDLEKELLKTREESNELKLKYHDLIEINATLQNKFKELTDNSIIPQNTSNVIKQSLIYPGPPNFDENNHSGLRPSVMRANDRTLSRRLSVGNSERPSAKSNMSYNQQLIREPLNDRTFKEEKQNNQEILHSQSFQISKATNLKDKLSETKNILKNMRHSNKENL